MARITGPGNCRRVAIWSRLMAPQFVKAYVKDNKTDATDTETICEAVSRGRRRSLLEATGKLRYSYLTPINFRWSTSGSFASDKTRQRLRKLPPMLQIDHQHKHE